MGPDPNNPASPSTAPSWPVPQAGAPRWGESTGAPPPFPPTAAAGPPAVPPAQTGGPTAFPPPPAQPRRRRLPWILAAAVVVIALVATGVVLLVGRDSRFVFGTVNVDAGTVEVRSAPEGEFTALANGDALRLGDTVRTGADARATIDLADGSLLRLGKSASATFDEPTAGARVVTLLNGDAWLRITPDDGAATIGVATKGASIQGGGPGVLAAGCTADGGCTLQAVAGAIDLVPSDRDELALAPGEQATLDTDGAVIELGIADEDGELASWVTENQQADADAGLADPPAPADRAGALAGARVEGEWVFTLTVTESSADNFEVGDSFDTDIELSPTCAEGPCDFTAIFGRYSGEGTHGEDGTVDFVVAGPLQCVSTSTGAVTVPDNGPETLALTLSATAAEERDGALVVTALAGSARYDKEVRGACRPGDQVGSYSAEMDVTGTLG